MFIAQLGAQIPIADTVNHLGNKAEIGKQILPLPGRCPIEKIQVKSQRPPYAVIAQGNVLNLRAARIIHQIVSPYCLPPRGKVTYPPKIVGIVLVIACGQGRIAYLHRKGLSRSKSIFRSRAESEILAEAIAEKAVEIYIRGRGVIFVAADHNGRLARIQFNIVLRLPIQAHPIRCPERIGRIDRDIQPLPYPVAELLVDSAENVDIEIFRSKYSLERGAANCSAERPSGINEQTVHFPGKCGLPRQKKYARYQYSQFAHR